MRPPLFRRLPGLLLDLLPKLLPGLLPGLLLIALDTSPVRAADTANRPVQPVQVAIDWSGIPDSVVTRCRLQGLQNLLLQTLIEVGYAVVKDVGSEGISLELVASEKDILVQGQFANQRAARRVVIPVSCDATFILDLQAAIHSVVEELRPEQTEQSEQPEQKSNTSDVVNSGTQAPFETHGLSAADASTWFILGAGIDVPGSRYPLGVVTVGLVHRLGARITGTLSLDTGARTGGGVVVIQPAFSLQLGWLIADCAIQSAVAVNLAPAAHLFDRRDLGFGGHVDGRLGIVWLLRVSAWRLHLQLMPYLRLRPVSHRVDGSERYRSESWGIQLTLAWSGALD